MQLQEGSFTVKNQSNDPVHLKKNCQAFSIYTTSTANLFSPSNPHPLDIPPLVDVPIKDIVDNITFDGNLSKQDKTPFLTSISKHSAVFQPCLATIMPLAPCMHPSSLHPKPGQSQTSSEHLTMAAIKTCFSTRSASSFGSKVSSWTQWRLASSQS